ncbi:MAG TPA: muconolactone Delta-isomerase family protein [Blastocatellia bacterium]|nr:muconolactone Delta-isomerase family protein [Blastocatellia bacterium]
MQHLVEMKLANYGRQAGPPNPQDGISFIERFIFPSLELLKKLEAEKKVLAGGPVAGSIALAFIVSAESIQELDELLESLPVWPLMQTTVTPLTSYDGRMAAVRPRLERLKAMSRNDPTGTQQEEK